MAKDAKGHGSEKRGGGGLSVPDQHALRIARQTLNMPDAMVGVMGGPNKQQAQATVDRLAAARNDPNHPLGVLNRVVSQGTPIAGQDAAAASDLAGGHPKSGAVPVHSGASGPPSYQNVSTKPLVSNAARDRSDASFSPRPGGLQGFDRKASVARKKSRPI